MSGRRNFFRLTSAAGLCALAVMVPRSVDIPGSQTSAIGFGNDISKYTYRAASASAPTQIGALGDPLSDTREIAATIRFRLNSKPNPGELTEIFATASESSRGLHVVINEYGTAYLTFGRRDSSELEYFLVLLRENVFDGRIHTLRIKFDQRNDSSSVEFDGDLVALRDPRNGNSLDLQLIRLETPNVFLGGFGSHRFNGFAQIVRMSIRQNDRLIGFFGLRFAFIIFAIALGISVRFRDDPL